MGPGGLFLRPARRVAHRMGAPHRMAHPPGIRQLEGSVLHIGEGALAGGLLAREVIAGLAWADSSRLLSHSSCKSPDLTRPKGTPGLARLPTALSPTLHTCPRYPSEGRPAPESACWSLEAKAGGRRGGCLAGEEEEQEEREMASAAQNRSKPTRRAFASLLLTNAYLPPREAKEQGYVPRRPSITFPMPPRLKG